MSCVTATIIVLCVCGVLLSRYAVHIEQLKHADESYQATCDLDETISCSQVLTSDYGVGLGLVSKLLGKEHVLNLPNSYGGLVFFPLMMILSLFSSPAIVLLSVFLSLLSCIASVYLIYVLVYVLHKICLICMPVHFINVFVFILFTIKWRTLKSRAATTNGSKTTTTKSKSGGSSRVGSQKPAADSPAAGSPKKRGKKSKNKKEQ